MARRPPPPQQMSPPQAPTNSRQNEYFIPRDGIDREVITADICRYLGNDALVRPGTYEDPETHHSISGYYITAYRNLTTAMIEDLKADSARWEQERRAKSSRNASGVQYHHSDTYARRQRGGPSESIPFGTGREFDAPPHDGPGYPGYPQQGGSGQFIQQPPQAGYSSGNQGNAYPTGYPTGPNQYPQQDPNYGPSGQSNLAYAQNQDTWVHAAARPVNPGYREPPYNTGIGTRDHMMTTPPQQGNYPPPPHPQAGYGGQDFYNPPSGGSYQTMAQDPHYGRGGGAYQERAPSAPLTKPTERFGSVAPTQPTPEVYGTQGPMQGQMQGQQYDDPNRNHKNQGSGPPRRQEAPKHQPYKTR